MTYALAAGLAADRADPVLRATDGCDGHGMIVVDH
jgi:hypothetical protein